MLQNNCNHVSGDDSNDNGFRLMIKEGDECECNVVRNLITDEKMKANFLKYTDISLIPDEYKKGKDYYLNYSPDVHGPNCKECDEKNDRFKSRNSG